MKTWTEKPPALLRVLVFPDGRTDPNRRELKRRREDLERSGYRVKIERIAVKLANPPEGRR